KARQDRLLEAPLLVGFVQPVPAFADQPGGAVVAVQRRVIAVEVHEAALAIQDGDAVERGLDGRKPILEQLFGRLLVADVRADAHIAALRGAAVPGPDYASVGP